MHDGIMLLAFCFTELVVILPVIAFNLSARVLDGAFSWGRDYAREHRIIQRYLRPTGIWPIPTVDLHAGFVALSVRPSSCHGMS
ncbi:uncharacterized protein EDB93DRAFT_1113569 [Suillus bovinus]|uniref:uncharacterized protein n=1 Tax=Suillus bovinus TaxID=48563 RepID=UPI001B8720D1|nr:uncharacterized protein EDB93DRAFT_1113569 [Suillus bovinus]KAG2160137.1 hypothetical protein EDB93DRAFT_1113569 [Suillus bovinus]